MAYVEYVATESVMTGHASSVTYGFEFSTQRADRTVEVLKEAPRSLSGVVEVLHFGRVVRWDVLMFPIPTIEADLYREFLDSTADGQTFVFDPYGSRDAPQLSMSVYRMDGGYSERRCTITGDPRYSDHLEFGFAVGVRS